MPRKSLIQDLYNRAIELELNALIFNNKEARNPSLSKNLIFISIEHFTSIEFYTYINSLKEIGLTISIYLDEAHLLILEEDFREKLKSIDTILKFKL